MALIKLADQLSVCLQPIADQLRSRGVYVYDPSSYARECYHDYLTKYVERKGKALLIGMNPGPWGMTQTGVPFGAVPWVVNWLKIKGRIEQPEQVHEKLPILGLACPRIEVSGNRLWGLFNHLYGSATQMSKKLSLLNYCPLLLLKQGEKRCSNLPLNKLSSKTEASLLKICDENLRAVIDELCPSQVIGIGSWVTQRIRKVVPDDISVGQILHPSPASPVANRGFAAQAETQLGQLGLV